MINIRPMKESDLDRGFLDVLSHLSKVGNISPDRRCQVWLNRELGNYHTLVAVDGNEQVVGTATLVLQWKFLHEGRKAGRISDVVVHRLFQGRGIGGRLIEELKKIAIKEGCYKLTLNCSRENVALYEKFGFREHEVAMRVDFL